MLFIKLIIIFPFITKPREPRFSVTKLITFSKTCNLFTQNFKLFFMQTINPITRKMAFPRENAPNVI